MLLGQDLLALLLLLAGLMQSAISQVPVPVAASPAGLRAMLQDATLSTVSMAGNLNLDATSWNDTFVVDRNIRIRGNNDFSKSTLDFGGLVAALRVAPGAVLSLENLRITGIPALDTLNYSRIGDLPAFWGSTCWPSIVSDMTSTLAFDNMEIRNALLSNISCKSIQNLLAENSSNYGALSGMSPAGNAVSIFGPLNFKATVFNVSDGAAGGSASVRVTDTSIRCYGPVTGVATVRPLAPMPGPIMLPHDAPAPGPSHQPGIDASATPASSSSQGLSGGAAAGIAVGIVAAVLLAACMGGFVWLQKRRKGHSSASDTSSQPMNKDNVPASVTLLTLSDSSGRTSSHTSHQVLPGPFDPIHHLSEASKQSRAMVERNNESTTQNVSPTQTESVSDISHLSHMLQFEWRIEPHRLQICKHPDDTNWRLGRGAYGLVYKARLDEVKDVAVKFLLPCDLHLIQQFAAEVDLCRACRDENLVTFTGAWFQQDLTYMVTELLPRGDLFRALADSASRQELSWYRRGKFVALDVAKGLFYLHSNNVVHMDIKSPNILFTKDWVAKIADVGLARLLSQSQPHTLLGGTYNWQSPEVLMGKPASYSADIWSFGVVLLEIVSGQQPERSRYPIPAVPEQAPPDIVQLIDECMETSPILRPSAKQIIARISQHIHQLPDSTIQAEQPE